MEADGTTKVKTKKKSTAIADVLVYQLVDFEGCDRSSRAEGLQVQQGRGNRFLVFSSSSCQTAILPPLSDVYPPRSHLIIEDFYPFFRTEPDAKVAFAQFDKDKNGDIPKKEMREAVQRIYRERKALSTSPKDMSSAVSKLDAVMIGVVLITTLFVCLLIFNPGNDISSLIPLATIVLGFPFVFGNLAKSIFNSHAHVRRWGFGSHRRYGAVPQRIWTVHHDV